MFNLAAELTTDSLGSTLDALDRGREKADKALNTAVKITAFRAKNLLQKEIRGGTVGAKKTEPLSYIARRLWGRSPNRAPLRSLATGVRYAVRDKKPYTMAVGFIPERSGGWIKTAEKHQKGFERTISHGQRKLIVGRGGRLGVAEGSNTPFFLKRSTKKFKTPGRPLVAPFWAHHHDQFQKNIAKNFKAKMAGKRI
ncbi:MAG: hypothetical protein JEZ12_23555 [Desulfobacterium sp.]|nr:hypothetical protein [Desulfobacterium sp.]